MNWIKRRYPVRVVMAYGQTQSANYAQSIALSMFMSMFPLMLGVLAILGLAIHDPHLQGRVQRALVGFFPSDARGALVHTLSGVRGHPGVLGVIGILGMLWGGGSIFTTMEWVLDRLFGVPQRGFLSQRAMALGMTAIFALAIVLSVFVNSALALVRFVPFLAPVTGAVIWVLFMLTIYRVVPHKTFTTVEVLPGALVAGVLMEALSLIWPLYMHFTHGFSTYGAAFALFFLLVTWLYFLSQFIMLGAVVNRLSLGPPLEESAPSELGRKEAGLEGDPEPSVVRREPAG
ncbi:MAG: YihY/virulence factor BrkB family protein [Candidatus Dormibacterales bacterium]